MLDFLLRLLASQLGEIGEESEDSDASDAPSTSDASAEGTVPADDAEVVPDDQPAETAPDATTQKPDHFPDGENLDPTKLDPALQPIFKKMQGAYTKRMQAIAGIREKADVVDRFYNDQNFANQTLQAWAAQNGYQIVPKGGTPQGQAPGASQTPQELVNAFKAKLDPSLHWMAEPQAEAVWTVMQQLLSPLVQNQQQTQLASRQSEYDRHATELAGRAPGWEEHEDDMSELLSFMESKQLSHPRFGSKLQLLYDMATSRASALAEATNRVNAAAKNRSSIPRGGARAVPKIDDAVKNAKTNQDAWALIRKQVLAKANGATS